MNHSMSHLNGSSPTPHDLDADPAHVSHPIVNRRIDHNVRQMRTTARNLEKCARKRESEVKALEKCLQRIELANRRIDDSISDMRTLQNTLDAKFGERHTNRP